MDHIEYIKDNYAIKKAVAMVMGKYGFVSAVRLVYDIIKIPYMGDNLLKTARDIVLEMFADGDDYENMENRNRVYEERARKFIETQDSLVNFKYEKI